MSENLEELRQEIRDIADKNGNLEDDVATLKKEHAREVADLQEKIDTLRSALDSIDRDIRGTLYDTR